MRYSSTQPFFLIYKTTHGMFLSVIDHHVKFINKGTVNEYIFLSSLHLEVGSNFSAFFNIHRAYNILE
jgi:hypothetical protein